MNKEMVIGVLEVADIHAGHIQYTIEKLMPRMPLSGDDIKNFTREDILISELFINRFSKLQDLIGTKLFTSTLEYAGELATTMSLVDKLNRLDQLTIVNPQKWQKLRETRNHLAHEYPDHPELTARYLNEAFELSAYLLEVLANIKVFLQPV
jgi:hypothetical protein